MEEIKLRRAEVNDLPAIIAVIADDPQAVYPELVRDPLPSCYGEAFAEIAADANAYMLVCERAGIVVGYSQLWFLRGLGKQGALWARLGDVQVASAARGGGIGRHMVKHAIELSRERGCKIMFLISNESRVDAHRFYKRLGFISTHQGMTLAL